MRLGALPLTLCLGACESGAPQKPRVEPGEEPLETASLPDEEVVSLAPEKARSTPARGRPFPCSWASAWTDDAEPDPLLAGVGGVPNPEKISDAPIQIPVKDPSPEGEMTVEVVIRSDGSVSEASVVHSTDPPWPEAERAILESVKKWRYRPPVFDGTPVSLCATLLVGL
jgi:TonB family protein